MEIARSLGWSEGKAGEPTPLKPKESAEGGEEDIWDKSDDEGEARKPKGEGGAMGRVTSTLAMEDDEGSSSALSNLAIAGDVPALLEYLQGHPDADVNAVDENVRFMHQTAPTAISYCNDTELHSLAPSSRQGTP